MNTKHWTHTILLLAAILSLVAGAATAETYTLGSLEIGNPWARATPKGASVGGAYMTISNKGAEADRLIGASSPIANQMEVHQMTMDKGVMAMRPVPGGLERVDRDDHLRVVRERVAAGGQGSPHRLTPRCATMRTHACSSSSPTSSPRTRSSS